MACTVVVSTDLDNRARIHELVVGVSRELVFDDVLAPVFGEPAVPTGAPGGGR